tara:strand:+ start:5089 stop:6423 length:1335 start_codon:yes stop_codon:yes gene_type:complete
MPPRKKHTRGRYVSRRKKKTNATRRKQKGYRHSRKNPQSRKHDSLQSKLKSIEYLAENPIVSLNPIPYIPNEDDYNPSINEYIMSLNSLSPNVLAGTMSADILVKDRVDGEWVRLNWEGPNAKRVMLENLRSKKPIVCTDIVAPKQIKHNCWFNAFFLIFFVSDAGRKFNRWMREAMITGKIVSKDGSGPSILRRDLRKPLFILNNYIEASTRNGYDAENFADKMDTNEIIAMIYDAIGGEMNDYGWDNAQINPVGVMANPMSFYNALYYAIGGNYEPYTSLWIDGELGYTDITDAVEHGALEGYRNKIYKMIYIEMSEIGSMKFEKPIEFTIDIISDKQPYTCTYKLDSAVLRSVYGEHFSSYITCNGTELGSDGEAEDRLQSFEWKKKLNDKITGSWKLASDDGMIFDFTYGYQTLVYYLTNKRINNTGNYRVCTYKIHGQI